MNKIRFLCSGLLLSGSLCTFAQFVPVTRNANIATSENFPVNAGGLSYYVRASAYGFGQDEGESGSENYNFASTFAEAGIRANYKWGFDEGYIIVAAEGRLRYGQYFNGKLNNDGTALNTNGRYETTLDLRDLYVGYRGRKWEILLGNQNIQWGRGMGSNPTNNLSASDLFFLSAGADDGKMYNFMLSVDYKINPGFDLQVVGIPLVQTSKMPLQLFNLGGLNLKEQTVPEAKIKNGAIAARLNLCGMLSGVSISYFNGYDPFPTLRAGFVDDDPSSGETEAGTVVNRKQTIGADFSFTFSGNPRVGHSVPSNSWTVFGEFGYNIYKKEDGLKYVQDNFAFNLGARRMVYMRNNVDMFMASVAWYGKYTPNFIELTHNTTDMDVYLYESNLVMGRFFNGQQKQLDHSMMVVLSQSVARQKLNFSVVYTLGLIKPLDFTGTVEGDRNMMLNVQGVYNISSSLSLTAGYKRMFGSSATMYGPIMGGVFTELKVRF